jgi:hypothetical protein
VSICGRSKRTALGLRLLCAAERPALSRCCEAGMNTDMRHLPVPASLREFLRDESRAASVFIWSLAAVGAASFSVAVLAIAFMK